MSLFNKLFGISKTINDSFFGKMEVDKVTVNNTEIHYFKCKKSLPGQNKKTGIIVIGGDAQIAQSQRDVVKNLINNYLEIMARIKAKIETNYSKQANEFNVKDITKDFILSSINIHQEDKGVVCWDLNYTNGNVYVNVEFAGNKIDHVDIDTY